MLLPFDDSRRLTGPNLYFGATGAVLEVVGIVPDEALLAGWRRRAERALGWLGWSERELVARRHASGVSLAVRAPCDQLFTATELNEWALCATLAELEPARTEELMTALLAAALKNADDPASVIPPLLEEAGARARLQTLAAREAQPALQRLLAAAHGLQVVLDETTLTLGSGTGAHNFLLSALPTADEVPWAEVHGVPTAVVTGSNGKTTTVRLLAACATAAGRLAGYNCTDGVFLGGERVESGDYSGPAGARRVLRDARVQTAVLETARGGLLRRGLALLTADVAIVTNVSADHFGEYGIHDLDALAEVKLSVARLLSAASGLLVLNADDAVLCACAASQPADLRRGWFAQDADHPQLVAQRATGGATCGIRDGVLWLAQAGAETPLGVIANMPLAVGGSAAYNVANLAAAALGAVALGIAPATIAGVFACFGAAPSDNPGRLMRFEVGGVQVLVDYAHNPAGLCGLLTVAEHLRGGQGRLGLILGHAGNRLDDDIRALAQVAAAFRPALVVLKEDEAHLRGRALGEIPRLLRAELLRLGLPDAALPMCSTELEAARCALGWAKPGDVLALPVHSVLAREAVLAMLPLEARAAARRAARPPPARR
ncbi:MAG: Mur ligase family protein [Pseudomonadota bacterium]